MVDLLGRETIEKLSQDLSQEEKPKTRSASKDREWREPRSSKMLSTPYSTCFSERPASSCAFRNIAQHVFGQQILDVLRIIQVKLAVEDGRSFRIDACGIPRLAA